MNVVFIMTDTQSSYMVGAYGDPSVDTPNIDRLAEQGDPESNARYRKLYSIYRDMYPLLKEQFQRLADALK